MAATTCTNCGETCSADDLFCESCGYDFITGSLPSATDSSIPSPPSGANSSGPADVDSKASSTADLPPVPSLVDVATGDIPRVLIQIGLDRDFFAAMVTEGEVSLPDPAPVDQQLELFGDELHIGRTSDSRGVHPNVDVEALTGDPAVSTKHAVLRVANDGSFTVTDVGSTNGTFVDDYSGEPITQGVPVTLKSDSSVFVGAWTKLTVTPG